MGGNLPRGRYDFEDIPQLNALLDHGLLLGLVDDDHTQYLLANGTRNLAGNWNLGGFNLTNGAAITATSLSSAGALDISATTNLNLVPSGDLVLNPLSEILLGKNVNGQSLRDLVNMVHGTFFGTVQAEQITSTDNITMQGHAFTMGDVGAATDSLLVFLGSTNVGGILFDESADAFNFGDSAFASTAANTAYILGRNQLGVALDFATFGYRGHGSSNYGVLQNSSFATWVHAGAGQDIAFSPGHTRAATWKADGKLGINTTIPATQLQVVGSVRVGDQATNYTGISTTGSITQAGSAIATFGNTTIGGTLDVTGNIDPTSYETTRGGFKDEDNMVSDSATVVASQQSIKKYVDDQIVSPKKFIITATQYAGTGSLELTGDIKLDKDEYCYYRTFIDSDIDDSKDIVITVVMSTDKADATYNLTLYVATTPTDNSATAPVGWDVEDAIAVTFDSTIANKLSKYQYILEHEDYSTGDMLTLAIENEEPTNNVWAYCCTFELTAA